MAISSDAVTGTAGAVTGDMWTADTFTSDQYSQVTVTSTQLTGGQWIGPAVRVQDGGQDAYVGIYYWNSGSPELMLFKRSGGGWAQLGGVYSSGPLAAGTQLELDGRRLHDLLPGERHSGHRRPRTAASPAARRASWPTATPKPAAGPAGTPRLTRSAGLFRGFPGRWCLQDNGGDNLSVSSNGSFTFATPGARWRAAYDVTVKTTSQTCRSGVRAASLHGLRRLGHGGLGKRHQCRGLLHG